MKKECSELGGCLFVVFFSIVLAVVSMSYRQISTIYIMLGVSIILAIFWYTEMPSRSIPILFITYTLVGVGLCFSGYEKTVLFYMFNSSNVLDNFIGSKSLVNSVAFRSNVMVLQLFIVVTIIFHMVCQCVVVITTILDYSSAVHSLRRDETIQRTFKDGLTVRAPEVIKEFTTTIKCGLISLIAVHSFIMIPYISWCKGFSPIWCSWALVVITVCTPILLYKIADRDLHRQYEDGVIPYMGDNSVKYLSMNGDDKAAVGIQFKEVQGVSGEYISGIVTDEDITRQKDCEDN